MMTCNTLYNPKIFLECTHYAYINIILVLNIFHQQQLRVFRRTIDGPRLPIEISKGYEELPNDVVAFKLLRRVLLHLIALSNLKL